MPERIEDRTPFSQGPETFPDNPSLARFARRLHEDLNPDNIGADYVPTVGNRMDLGKEDRGWRTAFVNGISIASTSTLQGRMEVARGGIMDFATNSSLVVIPTYTSGSSPFDLWHPSSPWLRPGAIWLSRSA